MDVSINGLKDWLFSVLRRSTAKMLFGHYKYQINMLYKSMTVKFTWPICLSSFVTCATYEVGTFCSILALFKIKILSYSKNKDTKQRSNFYCFTCISSTDVPIWVQFSQARYKTTYKHSIYSHKLHVTDWPFM